MAHPARARDAQRDARLAEGFAADVRAQQQVAVVAFDSSGPSKALRPMLERVIADHNRATDEDVQLDPLSLGRYKAACAAWVADIKATSITHAGDNRLGNLAVQVPGRRLGDDGWIWDNRVGDVTPLTAATCAAAVADSLPEPTSKTYDVLQSVL